MILSISLMHALLSLVLLGVAAHVLAKGRKSLLAVTMIGFILIDSLGVSFAPYLPLSDIVYLNSPSFIINEQNETFYFPQVVSHWLFFLISFSFLLIEMSRKRTGEGFGTVQAFVRVNYRLVIAVLMTVGIMAYLRYFISGPGLAILKSTQIQFTSTSNAVQARSELRNLLETGQGAYMAALSAKILFPVSAMILFIKRDKLRYAIWVMCAVSSLAYAFQTREKSPLVIALMIYVMMPLTQFINLGSTKVKARFNLKSIVFMCSAIVASFYFMGTLLYVVNFGLSFADAFDSIVARTLAIPAATEANFFFVFPEKFEFRGLDNIFKIPLMGFNGDDISIFQVAYAATGDVFATNASFLAVAWSGGGYLGVAAISLLLCGLLSFLDKSLSKLDYGLFLACVLLSTPAFIGLSSGSFLDYVGWGGILSPLFVIVTLKYLAPELGSRNQAIKTPSDVIAVRSVR